MSCLRSTISTRGNLMPHTSADEIASDNQHSTLSRRQFCQTAIAIGAAGAGIASGFPGMGGSTTAAAQTKLHAGRYIDVHTHIGQVWNNTETLPIEKLLAWMDESDIAQAVVLPLVSPESS